METLILMPFFILMWYMRGFTSHNSITKEKKIKITIVKQERLRIATCKKTDTQVDILNPYFSHGYRLKSIYGL